MMKKLTATLIAVATLIVIFASATAEAKPYCYKGPNNTIRCVGK